MPSGHRAEKGSDGHRFEAPLLFENEARVAMASPRHLGILASSGRGAARRPAGDGNDSDVTMASQIPSPDGHHGHMGVSTGEPPLFYCPTRIMRPSFSPVRQ